MFHLYALYFLIMTLLGFLFMGIDKRKAQKGEWRISERVLFGIALLGGCFGSYLGMRVFHHKTRHMLFSVGLPLLLPLHLALLIYIMVRFA